MNMVCKPFLSDRLKLKNRFIMGSMHTGLEDRDDSLNALLAFYEDRCKGGVGLIVTGGISPVPEGRYSQRHKYIFQHSLKDHQFLVERVHSYGSKICLQLLHVGGCGQQDTLYGPSDSRSKINARKIKELNNQELESLIQKYKEAAIFAKSSGYDGIEINAAEGFLLSQFISSRTNKRKDQWGGSLENRFRLTSQILKEIRKVVQDELFISLRISYNDLYDPDQTLDEINDLATFINAQDIDLINITFGWIDSPRPTSSLLVVEDAFRKYYAQAKRIFKHPIAVGHRVVEAKSINEIINNGESDLICLARPFLADENFISKMIGESSQVINSCIGCNQSCMDRAFFGADESEKKEISCMVNPRACREWKIKTQPLPDTFKVCVVGGGLSGLVSAQAFKSRGATVDLFEKEGELGGKFLLASKIPSKKQFQRTIEYFTSAIKELGVNIYLNKSPSLKVLDKYDLVVDATGLSSISLDNESIKIYSYEEVLNHNLKFTDIVCIIGGGGVGLDICEYLLEKSPNLKIKFFEKKSGLLGHGVSKGTAYFRRKNLEKYHIEVFDGVENVVITDQAVTAKRLGEKVEVKHFESVILCMGLTPNTALFNDYFMNKNRYIRVGSQKDAKNKSADYIIEQAYFTSMNFEKEN